MGLQPGCRLLHDQLRGRLQSKFSLRGLALWLVLTILKSVPKTAGTLTIINLSLNVPLIALYIIL